MNQMDVAKCDRIQLFASFKIQADQKFNQPWKFSLCHSKATNQYLCVFQTNSTFAKDKLIMCKISSLQTSFLEIRIFQIEPWEKKSFYKNKAFQSLDITSPILTSGLGNSDIHLKPQAFVFLFYFLTSYRQFEEREIKDQKDKNI